MRLSIVSCFLCFFIGSLFAQPRTDEEAIRAVADAWEQGLVEELSFYFDRPVGDNRKHGPSLIINIAIEIMKLYSK